MQIEFTEIMFACLRSHTPEALTLVCVCVCSGHLMMSSLWLFLRTDSHFLFWWAAQITPGLARRASLSIAVKQNCQTSGFN